MSTTEQSGVTPPIPYVLVTVTLDGRETLAPFGDETALRAAWLLAREDPTVSEARAKRRDGDPRARERCTWSRLGEFIDRTEAHRAELVALAATLTADAPAGFTVDVEGTGIIFRGNPTPHRLEVSCSDASRVLAHWKGYRPATPEAGAS
jgi:hypothetical protein